MPISRKFILIPVVFWMTLFLIHKIPASSHGLFSPILETHKANTLTLNTFTEKAKGLIHIRSIRRTPKGWLHIHILQIDLKNPHLYIDTLTPPDASASTMPLDQMLLKSGAKAGINAGFFELQPPQYPIGPVIQNGTIRSLDSFLNAYSQSFATFSMDFQKNPSIRFWEQPHFEIQIESGKSILIDQFNKSAPYSLSGFSMYDTTYSKTTLSKPDTIEILLKDHQIVEIRENMPSTDLPKNGYAIVTSSQNKEQVRALFPIGARVTWNPTFSPTVDLKNIRMAVTGSSPLLLDGNIPHPFSYDSPGSHPRSAIGFDPTQSLLYLVTVDGRQNLSVGMTLTELAHFMKELGCLYALNLDGGGSTSMAVASHDASTVTVLNSPSEGRLRRISTGIGIFDTSNKEDASLELIPYETTQPLIPHAPAQKMPGPENHKSYAFAVIGDLPHKTLHAQTIRKALQTRTKSLMTRVFMDASQSEIASFDSLSSRFIFLPEMKDAAQFDLLIEKLNFKGDRLFLFLKNHPEHATKLSQELLEALLSNHSQSTQTKVFVFFNHTQPIRFTKKQVEYIGVHSIPNDWGTFLYKRFWDEKVPFLMVEVSPLDVKISEENLRLNPRDIKKTPLTIVR
jgi:hypothetical protein